MLQRLKANYKEVFLFVKSVLMDLAAGKHVEYSTISHVAGRIFKSIDEADYAVEHIMNIRACDDYTYYHSINVALYSMLIGKWMNMPEDKIYDIIISGFLHDIGKLGIPKDILNKKGRLTAEEFEAVKKHSTIGYEMLKHDDRIHASIKEAVLQHHERMDGSGYPLRVMGDSICDYAKIIAVADVYDAMTADRVYKKKSTPFSAFQMFLTSGRGLFDAFVVKAFISNIVPYMIGTKVKLNDGKVGEVVYIPLHEIEKPVIRVESSYLDLSKNKELQIESVIWKGMRTRRQGIAVDSTYQKRTHCIVP